jgi:hypothetical protein
VGRAHIPETGAPGHKWTGDHGLVGRGTGMGHGGDGVYAVRKCGGGDGDPTALCQYMIRNDRFIDSYADRPYRGAGLVEDHIERSFVRLQCPGGETRDHRNRPARNTVLVDGSDGHLAVRVRLRHIAGRDADFVMAALGQFHGGKRVPVDVGGPVWQNPAGDDSLRRLVWRKVRRMSEVSMPPRSRERSFSSRTIPQVICGGRAYE